MQRRKICRYFERGSCRKDNCPFVHLKENRKTCNFYLNGQCRKGNQCNFFHPPKEEEKLDKLKQELKDNNKKKGNAQKKKESSDEEENEKQETQIEPEAEQKKKQEPNVDKEQIFEAEKEENPIESKKVEQSPEQRNIQSDKIDKINFLLGLNNDQQSEESQVQQQGQDIPSPKQLIQFTKIFPKKFPDHNKAKEMKEHIKQNELKFFKGEKFLDVISKLQDPVEKEYYQVIRKFTDHFVPFQGQHFHFTLKMRPLLFEKQMELHFDFKEDSLDLEIQGQKYPKERATFIILNPSIPKDYKLKFLEYINKYHFNKPVFDTLKFIQNNFEKLYKESHFKLENEFYSRKELQKKLKEVQRREDDGPSDIKTKRKRTRARGEKMSNPFVIETKIPENQKINNIFYTYQVTADSLKLQNCEYIVVEKMLMYIECVCQQKIMYIFDTTQDRSLKVNVKLECRKCRNVMLVGMEKEVVQMRRQTFCQIGVTSGHLMDLGGVGFKVGCVCNNEISKGKMYLPGEKINVNCHNCFHAMHIEFMGLKCYNPTLKTPQVIADHELPNKGCCKHMKLTFRWYRYGCCGRCFSCDDCHIMNSIAVHEKMKGITMLCGYCSKQQLIADNCSFCNKQLVKGAEKTGHWQGGFGCRDQTNLSRKDNKKYTGLTKKKEKEK